VALQIQSRLLSGWAMREWDMVVSDIVEKMNLFFLQQNASRDRMNWCITPAFVEESTILVKCIEEIRVSLRSQPIEVTDFEIGPLFIC
jgi:hypothetical protein